MSRPKNQTTSTSETTSIWKRLLDAIKKSLGSDNKWVWALLVIIGSLFGVSIDEIDSQSMAKALGLVTVEQLEGLATKEDLDEIQTNIEILRQQIEQLEQMSPRLQQLEEWRDARSSK